VKKSVKTDWKEVKTKAEETLANTKTDFTAIKQDIKEAWEDITEKDNS
jgi:hypothetical protein